MERILIDIVLGLDYRDLVSLTSNKSLISDWPKSCGGSHSGLSTQFDLNMPRVYISSEKPYFHRMSYSIPLIIDALHKIQNLISAACYPSYS